MTPRDANRNISGIQGKSIKAHVAFNDVKVSQSEHFTNSRLSNQNTLIIQWRKCKPINILFHRLYQRNLSFNLTVEKGVVLHLNKLESAWHKYRLYKIDWNWSSGSGEEEENVKSLRQRQRRQQERWRQRWRTKDKLLSEKLTWAFGSGEPKRPWNFSLLNKQLISFPKNLFPHVVVRNFIFIAKIWTS